MTPASIAGIEPAFKRNFSLGREAGAAVSVWKDGRELLSLHAGHRDAAGREPWTEDTLVLIWSATKGPASACVVHATVRAGFDLGTPVAEFWPRFAGNGKARTTIGQVLSHDAGLAALDDTSVSLLDHDAVIRAVENQKPVLAPGQGPAYGPRTFGFIADEIVRRLTGGVPLGSYWRSVFADPLGLDIWIGLPEDLHSRVATMLPPRFTPGGSRDPFLEALSDPDSLAKKAFSSPTGPAAASAMNSPALRSASLPSLGGIGSASALAKFYSLLASSDAGVADTPCASLPREWLTTRLTQGFDPVLQIETSFCAGFMMDPIDATGHKQRAVMGPSSNAFGHPGAGGSLAFADPTCGIGFAYVMNRMETGVLPKERALCLVEALYAG